MFSENDAKIHNETNIIWVPEFSVDAKRAENNNFHTKIIFSMFLY